MDKIPQQLIDTSVINQRIKEKIFILKDTF